MRRKQQGGDEIELNIANNSGDMVTCGLEYEIQVLKGTSWDDCTNETAFDGIGIEILPDESYIQNIPIVNADIGNGETYRIKKVVGEHEYYSNEFVIE